MTREAVILLHITLALVIIGVLTVYSAGTMDPIGAGEGHTFDRLWTQLGYVGLGFGALLFAARFDYHHLRKRPILYAIAGSVALMLAAVLVVGVERHGAVRWLRIAGGLTIQPSDLAKLAVVVLLAVKLAENQDEMPSFLRGLVPPMALALAFAGLILIEPDLGTPAVIGATALLMVFVAGARLHHLAAGFVPLGLGAAGYILINPHAKDRITAFMRPWEYRSDEGFQLLQALYAIASGGLWGRGAGAGQGKLDYIFAADSDFVFAVWSEEMGLAGALAVVLLFAAFLVLAFRVAFKARDTLGALLATGIACVIGLQAVLNLAVTTGLLPTKGLTLPFMSAGGTATVVYLAMTGILLNVALQAPAPGEKHNVAA